MAVIRPFECVRPAEKVADRVAALPYDVYDSKEARAEVEREPLSFLKIDRPSLMNQLICIVSRYIRKPMICLWKL